MSDIEAGSPRVLNDLERYAQAITVSGWPLVDVHGERGLVANFNALVSIELNPPYIKEGESMQEYGKRRQDAARVVADTLDKNEEAFLKRNAGNKDREVRDECTLRFGESVVYAVLREGLRQSKPTVRSEPVPVHTTTRRFSDSRFHEPWRL